jgi:phage terminase large subunit-like protein
LASKRQLRWPTGARSLIFTADEPDRLRGKQHTGLWCDELAAWRYQEAWDQAMLGLRLGSNPQAVVTTTPRPSKLIKALMDAPWTVTTSGTTYENRDNLAPAFFERIITKYEGTRMGRQELNAELLDDCPGAMWKLASIDDSRVKAAPALSRVVVAVDPAVTSNDKSDETGIVVCAKGADGHGYVLEDGSGKFTPLEWATRAVALYDKWGADRVVAEVNNGGDLVEANLRQVRKAVPFTAVRASRGKVIRAEPVSALYEQGRCHHVGNHPGLEDQMTTWDGTTGEKSPDRVDALVWGMTDLIVAGIDPGALWA